VDIESYIAIGSFILSRLVGYTHKVRVVDVGKNFIILKGRA